MAVGAPVVAMASRVGTGALRGLDDFARPEAARADLDPLDAAVDHRPDGLEVGLEPARPDVVSVTDGSAHDGALFADFAALCHMSVQGVWRSLSAPDKLPIIAGPPERTQKTPHGTMMPLLEASSASPCPSP